MTHYRGKPFCFRGFRTVLGSLDWDLVAGDGGTADTRIFSPLLSTELPGPGKGAVLSVNSLRRQELRDGADYVHLESTVRHIWCLA